MLKGQGVNLAALRGMGLVPPNPKSGFAAGTIYSLTNTAALIDFGTTDPSITLTAPGTYLILARARIDYNAATFAAVRTATLKLRRTNNTAADLANGAVAAKTDILTLITSTFCEKAWWALYTTANSDDIIQLFGSLDVVPTAGSLDIAEASLIAIQLA